MKCDLISDNKKLTKVNCDLVSDYHKLTDRILRLRNSVRNYRFFQVVEEKEKLRKEIEELKNFNAFLVSTLNGTGYFFQPVTQSL